jgi:hypothetical protein
MRTVLGVAVLAGLAVIVALPARAQETQHPAVTAENLRAQMRDVQAQEADLKVRLDQLNWDLKPENIEHYFAGVGSTRPEELREQRRRQLQLQKDATVNQLEQLATSKQRLEAAILATETQAYQQGMMGKTSLVVHRIWGDHRPLVLTGMVLTGALAGMLVVVPLVRRRRRNS